MGTQITLAKGIKMGLRKAMEDDPKVLVMGEDVGKLGGVFRVTDGLQKDFGEDRVIDTPLAESGIVGTAIGLAMRGYRPVCEIQFDGFVFPAFDQIVTQLAKMHARARGKVSLPVVIRIPVGGGIGAVEHHSESNEAYFAHTAGLRVVACSNPVDAYLMLQQAIASDDPVIFYEPKRRYWEKAELDESMTLDRRSRCTARGWPARAPTSPSRLRPHGEDRLEAATAAAEEGNCSRSSTCARCPRWTCRRCAPRSSGPAGCRRPRGPGVRRARRRDRGPGHRAVLLLPRGSGAARRRVRHAYPPAGWRRTTSPTWTACSTPSTVPSRTDPLGAAADEAVPAPRRR